MNGETDRQKDDLVKVNLSCTSSTLHYVEVEYRNEWDIVTYCMSWDILPCCAGSLVYLPQNSSGMSFMSSYYSVLSIMECRLIFF